MPESPSPPIRPTVKIAPNNPIFDLPVLVAIEEFGLRVAAIVEPTLIIEAGGIYHQRVSVPLADRVTQIRGLRRLGQWTAVEEDLPV